MARRTAPLCSLPGRRLLAGSAVVFAFLPALPASAVSHQQPPERHHTQLVGSGQNATGVSCSKSQHQQCIAVTATGFVAGERVLTRELRRPGWQQLLVADGRGMVRFRFVPQPHSDVLTFVGQGRPTRPGGLGNLAVSVPRIAIYRCPN